MKKLSLKALNRPDLETARRLPRKNVVVILDNIRSGLNVGAAFRTADAFAIRKIYLCGITAQPPHREILKSAIGATESVEWAYYNSTVDVVMELRKEGYEIIPIEQTDRSIMLGAFSFRQFDRLAVIFGNEVKGIQDTVIDMLDYSVEIPQTGIKHSLNVSVSIGIILWEIHRQLGDQV